MGVKYTKEQEDFIIKNYTGISRKNLTKIFNIKFNTNKSVNSIKSWCNSRKLNSGIDTRFSKEIKPWNKGVKGDIYFQHYDKQKVMKHMEKVHENNRKAKIGEESIINGVTHVRVVAGKRNLKYEGLVRKRYLVWEKVNGERPKDHCIVSLDGDQTNCDISNLACIPKKYMTLLCKNKWFSDTGIITETAIKWCELHYANKQ